MFSAFLFDKRSCGSFCSPHEVSAAATATLVLIEVMETMKRATYRNGRDLGALPLKCPIILAEEYPEYPVAKA